MLLIIVPLSVDNHQKVITRPPIICSLDLGLGRGSWDLYIFRLTRDHNGVALNIVWIPNMSGQNAARGALNFFRLTRDDNALPPKGSLI